MDRGIGSTPNTSPLASVAVLVAFVALTLIAGWIGSLATTPNIPTWYAGLEKPAFNPPNAVFPVAWTILYVLMAVAAWLVWRAPVGERRRVALTAWFVQLVLNVLWSFAFFGAQSPLAGLIVIVVLLAAIVVTILAFRRVNGRAALLLAPYLAWVAFATVLNASILSLNG
jgi:tryptophan-rich sensory protein